MFGTPEVLAQNWDAEILVARGMTHDVLKELFPEKHVIRIQLSSFDIFDALVQCRHEHAKKIALCIHCLLYTSHGRLSILKQIN